MSYSTSRELFQLSPHVVRPLPPACQIELPLPQTPGFTLNDMRTVPSLTRATLLATLWAVASVAVTARAVRATDVTLTIDVIEIFVIC